MKIGTLLKLKRGYVTDRQPNFWLVYETWKEGQHQSWRHYNLITGEKGWDRDTNAYDVVWEPE